MGTRRVQRRRVSALVLAGGLTLVPLAACGDDSQPGAADATPEVSVTESSPAEVTDGADQTTESTDAATGTAGSAEASGESDSDADVDCSGRECTVTLTGDGAEADVLGTSVVLGGVENGRATFRIGDQEVSCGQGESVSAGPLTLACSSVTDDAVAMTASLG
ncbi:hypothetical protein [Modestobacter altitudinis]|uniref:hypothetical protein n=1 Tax=Modestobacter altitudinis TaxID=2213158 RepID=UPI00110CF656|nr:hypothetical protein [Modestobacter altitudinis]